MKQALNPGGKLSVIRSTSAPSDRTSSHHASPAAGNIVAATADSGHSGSSKLHAAKSAATANSDQSSTLVALKLATVAERRHSSDTMPLNTLKVDYMLCYSPVIFTKHTLVDRV